MTVQTATHAIHSKPASPKRTLRLAIDASNLRGGGGVTHLVELLSHADARDAGFARVTVWAQPAVASHLPQRSWLEIKTPPHISGGLLARTWWQINQLGPWCEHNADLLFVPGGLYAGRYRPYVTMCRNMLPFDRESSNRYGVSRMGARLRLLTPLHARSFRAATSVVFLTEHARARVEQVTGPLATAAIIPHGISAAFRAQPRSQRPITAYTPAAPFKWLYVSIVDVYKHHTEVARAVAAMRRVGLPVAVDFVGPAYAPSLRRLERIMRELDPRGEFLRYVPSVAHQKLTDVYRGADAFVFASSCENLPNILLEAMAAGLPIACSERAPMPDILGDGGEYFEPTEVASIERAMRLITADVTHRQRIADLAFARAQKYSWEACARDTFAFLYRTGIASA